MAKKKTEYICSSCGFVSPKWAGRCSECGEWNSFVEEAVPEKTQSKQKGAGAVLPEITATPLRDIKGLEVDRHITGIGELDQVLGGGLVKGSVVLIGGEPGIGKSTIVMQAAGILAEGGRNVLYASGEESPAQLKIRSERLSVDADGIKILTTNNFEDVLGAASSERFDYIILDSIQTMASGELSGAAGTVGQVKHITYRLVELAKSRGITVLIVGQVTKDGYIAGPKVLEHLVDTVLYFEGDYDRGVRILRSVKNRFGPTNEVGLFEMGAKGLIERSDAGFLGDGQDSSAGKVLAPVIEGTRAFLVEIQALVTPTFYQFSRRNAMGYDVNRLSMLLAVLDKKGGMNLASSDIYLNVAGGMKINETSADLAVCAAIISSFREKPLPADAAYIGEVGLTGGIRNVSSTASRIQEAHKFGINRFYLPQKADIDKTDGIIEVKNINEFLDLI